MSIIESLVAIQIIKFSTKVLENIQKQKSEGVEVDEAAVEKNMELVNETARNIIKMIKAYEYNHN